MKSTRRPDRIPEEWVLAIAGRIRLLGDPKKLAILRCVSEREKSVSQPGAESGLGPANASKHLNMLAEGD
jgi:DNA-binding transcriptional ArsR family regulator